MSRQFRQTLEQNKLLASLKKKKNILELICAYSGGEIYWANANLRQRHDGPLAEQAHYQM